MPVIFAMTEWVSDPRHADVFAWAQLERYALALLGSTLLGWLSFSGLEQPVLRLRRHFCYRERLGSETSLDLEAGAATEPKSSRRRK